MANIQSLTLTVSIRPWFKALVDGPIATKIAAYAALKVLPIRAIMRFREGYGG